MPHMPHEYTVRDKAPDDADYVGLYEAIMRDGVIHWWRRQHARYLYPGDGWRRSTFRQGRKKVRGSPYRGLPNTPRAEMRIRRRAAAALRAF
jgi:hypothetical protein